VVLEPRGLEAGRRELRRRPERREQALRRARARLGSRMSLTRSRRSRRARCARYGNATVAAAAAAATEATCVLDIVVTRRCRAQFCVPRGVWPRGGANRGPNSPFCVVVEPKIPLTFGKLYIHILPCGEAFSFRYFSSLEGLYWHVDEDVHRTQVHTHVTSDPRAGAAVVAIGVGSPVAQPAKPLASSSASRRTWGGGGGKRGPHSAQPVTSSWAPGPPPSPSPSEAYEGIPIMQSLMQIAIGGGGRHTCGTQSSHSEP
jgi:hypothetical protein